MDRKNILFISHDTNLTGAPILLLDLMKWLKKNHPEFNLHVVLGKEGILKEDFEAISTVFSLDKKFNARYNFINNFKREKYLTKTHEKINDTKWDLIFSNTLVNGKILEKIEKKDTPIISYIHELEFSIQLFLKTEDVQETLLKTDYFICGSELVQQNLIKNHQINPEKSEVVYSFTTEEKSTKSSELNIELREKYNISKDALVVGMMGTAIWRKGIDLFYKTALETISENIHYIWVGDYPNYLTLQQEYEEKITGQKPKLTMIKSSKDYKKYFNFFDVFYLSSREDPYPLVAVEASLFGIPLICFENATGTQEFIKETFGKIIPYNNLEKVKDFLISCSQNKSILIDHANDIQDKSLAKHHIDKNASQIVGIMNEMLENLAHKKGKK